MEAMKKPNYLNNVDLLADIKESKKQGKLSNQLSLKFILLVDKVSRQYNFSDYTFLEDMKGNAILKLVEKWHMFDPEKGDNPFSYFTQLVNNQFKKELISEKYQRDVYNKSLIYAGFNPTGYSNVQTED